MTFRQNATHRLDVKRVQLLSNVNEERNIAVVMQQQIMQLLLSDYQIQLIDSLNWLQMPLSNFPKTCGLHLSTYSKGDFPFKFNTAENQNYVGLLPAIEN